MVRPKKGRRGRNKQNPGRKIRNPELEAFALNFVKDGILKTGKSTNRMGYFQWRLCIIMVCSHFFSRSYFRIIFKILTDLICYPKKINYPSEKLTFLGKTPRRKDIINHTLNFESKKEFKGSKGWCDKFMKRNKYKIDAWKRVVNHQKKN